MRSIVARCSKDNARVPMAVLFAVAVNTLIPSRVPGQPLAGTLVLCMSPAQ